jgi:hypothetical protein
VRLFEHWKSIGSLVGLATGAFVLYDRFVRGRPVVSLMVSNQPLRDARLLAITNPGDTYIVIRHVVVKPKVYGVAKSATARSLARASKGRPFSRQIAPHETVELPFVTLPAGQCADLRCVRIAVHWRKTTSLWLPQRPVVFWTSTREFRELGYADQT